MIVVGIVDRHRPQPERVVPRNDVGRNGDLDVGRLRLPGIEVALAVAVDGEPFRLGRTGYLHAQAAGAARAGLVGDVEYGGALRRRGVLRVAGALQLNSRRTVWDLEGGHDSLLLVIVFNSDFPGRVRGPLSG